MKNSLLITAAGPGKDAKRVVKALLLAGLYFKTGAGNEKAIVKRIHGKPMKVHALCMPETTE